MSAVHSPMLCGRVPVNLLRDVWEWPSVRTQCCNDVKLAALTYIKAGKSGPFHNCVRESSRKLVFRKPYITSLAPVSDGSGYSPHQHVVINSKYPHLFPRRPNEVRQSAREGILLDFKI